MRFLGILSLLMLSGCRGTVPRLNGPPEQGIASVLIGCRVILPTGETPTGRVSLNLDGEQGNSEVYRLPLKPQRALLFQIEPGAYRLSPTRSLFGSHQDRLKVAIEGHVYRVPFPREILRKPAFLVKPAKIVAIGTLEVEVAARLPDREPAVKIRLDDSTETRRKLVQSKIQAMMDPNAPESDRATALAWTRALEETLSQVLTESQREPAFRPGQ